MISVLLIEQYCNANLELDGVFVLPDMRRPWSKKLSHLASNPIPWISKNSIFQTLSTKCSSISPSGALHNLIYEFESPCQMEPSVENAAAFSMPGDIQTQRFKRVGSPLSKPFLHKRRLSAHSSVTKMAVGLRELAKKIDIYRLVQ